MTTAAIDLNALNDLFENQNKLDDVFNSIFDDDSFVSSSLSSSDHSPESNAQKDSSDLDLYEDFSFYAEDKTYGQNMPGIMRVVIPVVLEIIAFSYGIMYFT